MTRERAVILVALLAIFGAVAWSAWPHETTAAERVNSGQARQGISCDAGLFGITMSDTVGGESMAALCLTFHPGKGKDCTRGCHTLGEFAQKIGTLVHNKR